MGPSCIGKNKSLLLLLLLCNAMKHQALIYVLYVHGLTVFNGPFFSYGIHSDVSHVKYGNNLYLDVLVDVDYILI